MSASITSAAILLLRARARARGITTIDEIGLMRFNDARSPPCLRKKLRSFSPFLIAAASPFIIQLN